MNFVDREHCLLSLIKVQCGHSSIVKINGMLNDIFASAETNDEYGNFKVSSLLE